MWTGVTPGDGPQEVHVVLLDNGRTDVLADTVGRQALRCIRCSACLNVCPVYERTGGHAYGSVYPGPIGAILTPLLRGRATTPRSTRCPTPPACAGPASRCARCGSTSRGARPPACAGRRPHAVRGRPSVQDVAMRAASWVLGTAGRDCALGRLAGRGAGVLGAVARAHRTRRTAGAGIAAVAGVQPGPRPATRRSRRQSPSATGGGAPTAVAGDRARGDPGPDPGGAARRAARRGAGGRRAGR